ncbi:MAG: hypothetical protein LBB45_02055 [Methanobrevibacter sp.]|nr:hypothetical protein [Candidatus Methanovirga basalitermitum]
MNDNGEVSTSVTSGYTITTTVKGGMNLIHLSTGEKYEYGESKLNPNYKKELKGNGNDRNKILVSKRKINQNNYYYIDDIEAKTIQY